MKKKLFTLLLALIAIATTGRAQVVLNSKNFPDANFRKALAAELGISEGDEITEAKIATTTSLYIAEKSIANLTGIEHFTALTKLYCNNNQLTSLDVSQNAALKTLRCDNNQLTSLDVSKNIALEELSCNEIQLTSLDVSKNTALIWLACYGNQLTSLDVSNNKLLEGLYCSDNRLTRLNVSKTTMLTNLNCSGNRLTSLDVSQNTKLSYLVCSENQLTSLDVSKNTALTSLHCYNNQLNSLNVSKNAALLEWLGCWSNQIKGEAMDALVNNLPTVESGDCNVIDTWDGNEGNVCTKSQVAVAKGKGWTVYAFIAGWQEYEGSEDTTPSLKVDHTEIDIYLNTYGHVQVESGSGSYEVINKNPNIVETSFISDGLPAKALTPGQDGGKIDDHLTIKGIALGNATVQIKDKNTQEVAEVKVHVITAPHLSLSSYSQTLAVGGQVEVEVLTGSGMYEVATNNPNVVNVSSYTHTISTVSEDGSFSKDHDMIKITAKSKGRAIVTVKDLSSGEVAEIAVTVTDGSDDESGWQLVTDSGEKFPMSRVGMLVAVDESAYFSVLDINGNVLADEVLRVHFVNSDPVSVENITTEKTQNILKRYVNNELTLVGAKGTVNVYSVDGVKVATTYAAGQETIINVSSLPSGIYIVKCGNQSFKFNKK